MMYSIRCTLIVLCVLYLAPFAIHAQTSGNPSGHWDGSIQIPGQSLDFSIDLTKKDGVWSGTIDIPMQGARGLALEKLDIVPPKVSFVIGGAPGTPTFNGTFAGDSITGTFMQGGASFPFRMVRQSEAERKQEAAETASALDSIRTFIPAALKQWNVPGLAIAIVRDDSVIFAEGFGYRDAEKKQPVDARTLFAIGSSTKAFTAYILASLVAEGKLDWDTPVITYLPDFKLKDDYATNHLTPRDLVTHVSGLPRHDIIWYGSNLSRRELFERLQYLEPNAELREKWQYQNLMFMTAGYLAEQVAGKSWETLVRERIFEPLGMNASNFSVDSMRMVENRAIGYEEKGKGKEKTAKPMAYRNIDAIGPAGSINSNVTEMARWVMLHLDNGKYKGEQLLPEGEMATLHAPQVVMPGGLSSSSGEVLFNLYAMGWMEHAYRGRQLLEHGGNIDGFSAMVTFIPKEKLGMVILTNMNGTPLPTITMYTVYDHLLGYSNVDWNGKVLAQVAKGDSLEEAAKGKDDEDVVRVPNTRPSHRLKEYAGEYENPAYGVITVREVRDRLEAVYHGETAPLEHYHYDVFTIGGDSPLKDLKIQFRTNLKGDIASLTAPLEPSVEPIEFEHRAAAALADTMVLKRYVGEYELGGRAIRIHLEGSKLIATLTGQPDYELEPYREAEFNLKGLKGYSVRFEPKEGAVTKAVFIQPNGVFTATKK